MNFHLSFKILMKVKSTVKLPSKMCLYCAIVTQLLNISVILVVDASFITVISNEEECLCLA